MPKYFNPVKFFCAHPKSGISGLCMSYSLPSVYFLMLLEYKGAPISLYLCMMMILGQLESALWCEGSLIIHWKSMGDLGLTFSSRWSCCLFDIFTIPFVIIFHLDYEKSSNTLGLAHYQVHIKIWWSSSDFSGSMKSTGTLPKCSHFRYLQEC